MRHLLFLLLLLTACNPTKAPLRFEGAAMSMPFTIQIGDSTKEEAHIEAILISTMNEINQIYNNWNPNSEISYLNRLGAYEKVTLSPELAQFLRRVGELVHLTEGRFDPTVAPLVHLWKTSLQSGAPPSQEEIENVLPAVGWQNVHLENDLFWKDHPSTSFDVGGVAKGYTVDLLLDRLNAAGYENIYVEWGGEIHTTGRHPDHRPWTISIPGLTTIQLHDEAIATSGTYYQNWTIDDVNYVHIIDPLTKQPLTDPEIVSASVLFPTCMEADAYATSLMVFSTKAEAERWAKEHNITVHILARDSHN